MKKNIAINGFGRIGRLVFRQLIKFPEFNIVAINDLTDVKTLAHLLKYDSAQGKFDQKVSFCSKENENNLIVGDHEIKIFSERDPKNLPWKDLNIDVVVESTGIFRTKKLANNHIIAGAKKVCISAPASGDIKTIVYSINEKDINSEDKIVSGASCTTNCLAPIASILDKNFGIKKGFMTTIHGYTADQRIVDAPHKDLRRSRAAAQNIIPTSTGAAKALGIVIPNLKGKIDGMAMRVPVITGSAIDFVVEFNKDVTIEMIHEVIKKHVSSSLEYCEDEIVSTDIIGSTAGSVFDSKGTMMLDVDGSKMFKLLLWYDNENSYVSQFVRLVKHILK